MPYTKIQPLTDFMVQVFNPVAGTPAGSRLSLTAPFRGLLMEAGFMPASLVASAMTLAVSVGPNNVSSAAVTFTEVVTSTLGTFSSTNLYEGAVASVNPPSPTYVNAGDAIKLTASGGNTSAIGATMYAIIRKG